MQTSIIPYPTTEPLVPIRPAVIAGGGLLVAPDRGRAYLAGREVTLTADEATLLARLALTPNCPVRRTDLMALLPGVDHDTDPRVVDVHLVRLMVKLGDETVRLCHARAADGFVLMIR